MAAQVISREGHKGHKDGLFKQELREETEDKRPSGRANAKVREVPEFLQEIASAFGSTPGIEAVAWCGSAAMGVADAYSDFDFYVYTNAPVSVENRRSIVAKNRPVLGGGMQSSYLAQMKAAIARGDLISLNHRVAVWIASYTDILFAVNRRYHPGEKRLLTYLTGLPDLPEKALEDVPRICALAGSLSSPIIEHVSGMLSRLDRWLEDDGI